MRSGKWKYIREAKDEFLYDLSVDERENADFGKAHSQMLDRLRAEFKNWEASVVPYPPR